jgi:hypothetical protein
MNSSHRALSLAALLVAPGLAVAQDECIGALPVAAGTTPFDTTAATLSVEAWSCVATTAPDLWFTYVAAGGLPITVDTCGSAFDTAVSIYDGACGALNLIECNDDVCGTQSAITFTPVVGTTYTIRVGGWSTSFGVGVLNVFDRSAPSNVECDDARPIGGNGETVITTNASTSTQPWPCSGGTVFTHGRDVWFSYTPAFAGDFTINTCNAGTTYDTVLELFEGTCGALTSVACNDDVTCSPSFRSAITYCGAAGTTYIFRVGGYNGGSGTAEISITEALPPSNCVATAFPDNNGGSVGGAVYFNATFSQGVIIGALETNTNIAAGTPIVAEVHGRIGTYVGNTSSTAGWMLMGIADGISAGGGVLSSLTFQQPITVPAGTFGIAIVATNFNHRYTNGTATNIAAMSPDGVISLALGAAANVAFTGTAFTPRIWNGGFCYDVNVGSVYCSATPNSTGNPALLLVGGSDCVTADSLVLTAASLPANAFGYFLASTTQGSSNPPNSMGTLCLGGDIGRGVGGAILNSGPVGIIRTSSALTLPHPVLGMVQVTAGDTWNYQAWFRDSAGGVATSNFSDAASLTYH